MDTKHSPTPWRAVAYNENSPGDYKPAQVLDANNLPVVYLRDAGAAATAALIVEAVNSHASREALLVECREYLRTESCLCEPEDDDGDAITCGRCLLLSKLDKGA